MAGNGDRGAAAVEFALVSLLFVMMVMGVLEFGRMWAIQGSLAQAARDTAREMAIKDNKALASERFLSTFTPLGDPVPVSTESGPLHVIVHDPTGDPGDPGCRILVTAEYTTGTLTKFFGQEFTLGAEGAMRCGG